MAVLQAKAAAFSSITKTDGSPTEIPGTTVVYTMMVANAGPGVAAGATCTTPQIGNTGAIICT